MKILSSYKDYYDYLTGIYGEDPLIILDRRIHKQPYFIHNTNNPIKEYSLFIGNYCVDFLTYNGIPYFGEAVKTIPGVKTKMGKDLLSWQINLNERRYGMTWDKLLKYEPIEVSWTNFNHIEHSLIPLIPFKRKRPVELDDSIVISLGVYNDRYRAAKYKIESEYPILENLSLNKFIKPDVVYQWIVEYLAEQNMKRETHEDLRSDIQKIEGKGFDKRTSFRPKIK